MATTKVNGWRGAMPPLRQVLWTAGTCAAPLLVIRDVPAWLQAPAGVVAIACVLGLLATEPNAGRWA